MREGLYLGVVTHVRTRPRRHALRYGVFQLLLDLDALEGTGRRLRLLGVNRPGLMSFHERDHGDCDGRPLRGFVERMLREAGRPACAGPILIQCMPRVLGYGFNPLSLYYCHDAEGRLADIVLQVHNTFGQRHAYVLPVEGEGPARGRCAKAFHVSPFMPMDLDYRFDLTAPGEAVRSVVQAVDASGAVVLHADFTGQRRELTDRQLLGAMLRRPLLTWKVIAAIHIEAMKLLAKGVRLAPTPPRPSVEATLAQAES
ncbi:MAG TPA: DUF1365 domain-containing protein [Caulobacteraceae bacterium]|jgi:hypothetical protein|nr:DUF1365 domain-containing protein [Caulobacteraceae bacterium]